MACLCAHRQPLPPSSRRAVFSGALLSFLIPQVGPRGSRQAPPVDDEVRLAIDESELMAESTATQ